MVVNAIRKLEGFNSGRCPRFQSRRFFHVNTSIATGLLANAQVAASSYLKRRNIMNL